MKSINQSISLSAIPILTSVLSIHTMNNRNQQSMNQIISTKNNYKRTVYSNIHEVTAMLGRLDTTSLDCHRQRPLNLSANQQLNAWL